MRSSRIFLFVDPALTLSTSCLARTTRCKLLAELAKSSPVF